MKLTREDILKYATEEEKKILKEASPVKDALKIAFPEIGDENTMECPGCQGEQYVSGEPCDICFGTGVVATDYDTKAYYDRIHKHFSGGHTFPANENPTKDNMVKEEKILEGNSKYIDVLEILEELQQTYAKTKEEARERNLPYLDSLAYDIKTVIDKWDSYL